MFCTGKASLSWNTHFSIFGIECEKLLWTHWLWFLGKKNIKQNIFWYKWFIHLYYYLTRLSGSTMIALSCSSVTSTHEVNEDLIMFMTRSLERMSSFLTWSPVTLVLPAMPYLPEIFQSHELRDWNELLGIGSQWLFIEVLYKILKD